ncbi:MAG TPA: hypothetical protein DEQ78_02265 [Ruminococcaceae bacterium]|nr:hypothetical protein [Oscillospiraceae bacterium]HCE26092.1 hypothetical protein [Oscillospiraceae bacterium]
MAEQKKPTSSNGEFKTSPLGFDKNEVMAYIVQHNKERKALKEENDELKRALEEKKKANEGADNELTAELEKKKAELDAQILESRKQVLDERRKLAQTEKELHVLQDKHSALTEEFAAFKKQAATKIDKAKHSGGTIDPAQLAEISAKANADANAVIADAQKKAEEIITAAKAYFADTVQKTYDYKQAVLEKAGAFAENVTSSGAVAPAIDIAAVLATVSSALNDAIANAQSAIAEAMDEAKSKASDEVSAVNDAVSKAVEEAKSKDVPAAEAADIPEEKLSDNEELSAAKAELENIGGFDESELNSYAPMNVEPYSFELKLDMPAQTDDGDDDIDDMLSDNNGLLSSFEIVSGDDDISADNVDTGDLLVEEAPAVTGISDLLTEEPEVTAAPTEEPAPEADDFSDLLAEEPAPAPVAKVEPAPATDDFSDLLAEEPAPAPVAKAEPAPATDDFSDLLAEEPAPVPVAKTEPAPATDDFSDLLAEEPAPAPEAKPEPAPATDDFSDLLADTPAEVGRTADRGTEKPKEKLNESRSMGVAGKESNANDPWKDLEAQMNGMTITPPPSHKAVDDDGMTSSFDDPTAPAASAKEEKIDMSDYSSMLGGINDNMNTNTAQYDPSWDLKMMEGLNDNDDDDEMSSDNVGFFDL